MIESLSFYVYCFSKLKRDMKHGGAPHKPVLLLAVIQLYEKKELHSRYIHISPELVAAFKSIWSQVVVSNHHVIFALPFYHMSSEPFWKLVARPGCELWIQSKGAMRNLNNLMTAVQYAAIDEELFELLAQSESRDVLKNTLLEQYFKHTTEPLYYEDEIGKRAQLLHESSEEYRRKINELKNEVDQNTYQEEIYLRGGVFKREVPKIYNNTCAISGWRVDALVNVSMIDACHIVPFSESYDDSLQNGIALSPNLHRAFDRGLIAISDEYTVVVNSNFTETKSSYGIKQFEGVKIALPNETSMYPSLENIAQHRKKMGFEN